MTTPAAPVSSGDQTGARPGAPRIARAEALDPPFGTYALPASAEALRRIADAAPRRFLVSALRRMALAGRGEGPFDATVFGSQKARLHPRDNRTEKRVFAGPRFWDREERERIAAAMDPAAGPFHFVDAGANVGMYTLALRAAAQARGVAFRALAVEPDPVNGARLEANLAASGAQDVLMAPCALSDAPGMAQFLSGGLGNRGEARLVQGGDAPAPAETVIDVPLRPLAELLVDAGFPRVDAMKMDIEGHEAPALRGLFDHAPEALWPRLVVIETGRVEAGGGGDALALLETRGYALERRTRINAILRRAPRA